MPSLNVGETVNKPRTLVLCFDGTASEYDSDITNIVKFFALLRKDDFNEQLTYYQTGVGTWFNPGLVSSPFMWASKYLDMAFAIYLDSHILDGYRFLMQNYRVGDKICMFGFSRGAYTARALAATLYKVGLLPRENQAQVPFAFKLYQREDPKGIKLCAGFKQTFCYDVNVEFMGVWDTVSSVGVLMGRTLPFTNSNSSIKTFRHALSLDERRSRFQPSRWHYDTSNADRTAFDTEHASVAVSSSRPRKPDDVRNSITSVGGGKVDCVTETDVLEVWFAGCHSDVGGGVDHNKDQVTLSNVSLRWMVRQVIASGCGVQFDEVALAPIFSPTLSSPLLSLAHRTKNFSPIGLEDDDRQLDLVDALEPIHDDLTSNPLWWILEILPVQRYRQDKGGVWLGKFMSNLGRGREIMDKHPVFHDTVKLRMEITRLAYKPRAKYEYGSEIYVQ